MKVTSPVIGASPSAHDPEKLQTFRTRSMRKIKENRQRRRLNVIEKRADGNWRIIFRFEQGEATDVDLLDYH